jgi:hypothetical protein
MPQNDTAYLNALRAHAGETRSLLSNAQKPERERMVVRAFLRCLGIPFADEEIIAGNEEPVDVQFRTGRFQIREILGESKRGKEWAERELLYRAAKKISDVMTPNVESTTIPLAEAVKMVADALSKKSRHYGPRGCAVLDALVYIDLKNSHLDPTGRWDARNITAELDQQGWRSVSMLFVPFGLVLTGSAVAPSFLRSKIGLLLNVWPGPDGWFEP